MMEDKIESMISDRVKNIQDSLTLSLAEKTKILKDAGEAVISFGTGEPDFTTPEYICDGAKKAINAGYTKFDVVAGVLDLRKAISKKLRDDNGLDYPPENIIVNSGAKSSILIALQTILNPGDEVIVPRPYWVSYLEMIRLAGGVPIIAETQKSNNFKLTPDELIYAITTKTKAIILNAPVNPTGVIYTLEELLALSEVLVRNKILVISDEIYEEYVYENHKHISIASLNREIKNQTILVNGFSKTYVMTGWRLGYAAANAEIIDGMKRVQAHTLSHPSTISQYAGLTALQEKSNTVENIVRMFDERRLKMIEYLNRIPEIDYIYPESTFYIFVDISTVLNNRKNIINPDTSFGFAEKLLEVAKVIVIPGEAFGMPNYIRLSFAAAPIEEIDEGSHRLTQFIERY